MKNYYKILGVTMTATEDEIKKQFRTLAKQYHPDRNPDDETALRKFQDINEAYEVLKKEDSRKEYDKKLEKFTNQSTKEKPKDNKETKSSRTGSRDIKDSMEDLNSYFASFFGFDANSNEINKEKFSKENKNPIDTTNLFNSFFTPKKK